MTRRKTFNKQLAKRIAKECLFCGENDLKLVDAHRISYGEDGGTYCDRNTVICCALCHRKIHTGRIIIEGKYFSTSGQWKVFYKEDGEDKVK